MFNSKKKLSRFTSVFIPFLMPLKVADFLKILLIISAAGFDAMKNAVLDSQYDIFSIKIYFDD